MPFLNSSLGTLIRLNELPDEEKFEIDGGERNLMESSRRGEGVRGERSDELLRRCIPQHMYTYVADTCMRNVGAADSDAIFNVTKFPPFRLASLVAAQGASNSKVQKKRREENKILNLSKMRRVAAIFAMLRMSQLTPYEFDPSPNVQYHIQKNMLFMEGEEQYQQSLLCEPREGF
jgi:hypothetical protein